MRVIGTAGHVDHGKSTLVAALTGIHPDRLKEEQAREMTIDLGFAWLTLPNGEEIGIVDVPGHRDFIENMLAGVGGIDAALFVVAADEGIMPQTREHLAILDLLQIGGGVVALTKADLVDDEWLEMVEEEVRQALQGTVLEKAAIVRVSARTKQGLDQLKSALLDCLADQPRRINAGRARLPVDRVFTISGFGTVATGTLSDGALHTGDEVEILPGGKRGRIRGLQTYQKWVEIAEPGGRTAVNLAGVDLDEIHRGDVVVASGKYAPSQRLDVKVRLLPDASGALRNSGEVKLFLGTSEVIARVRLLGDEELQPGMSGWAQLETREPVVAMRGDRFILRRPSPGETIGGGVVVDARPERRYKRQDVAVLGHLEQLLHGTPGDVLYAALTSLGICTLREAATLAKMDIAQARLAVVEVDESGRLVWLSRNGDESLIAADVTWQDLSRRLQREIELYHGTFPLRRGIPREEIKSRLKISSRNFNAALSIWVGEGWVEERGLLLARPGFKVTFSAAQQAAVDQLLARFAAAPYSPPSVKDCRSGIGDELFNALVDQDTLIAVSAEVVFRKQDYEEMLRAVRAHLEQHGSLTVAEFRDRFNTSRKYALGLLEHLDAKGVTVREGDARRLRK